MGVLRVQPRNQDIIMRPWQVSGKLTQLAYLSIDVLCILIGSFLVFYVRFASDVLQQGLLYLKWHSPFSYLLPHYNYDYFLLLYIVLIVLFFKNYDLYRTPRGRVWKDEALLVIKGVSLATLILMVFMYLSKMQISRFVVLASCGLNLITLTGWRYFKRKALERRIAQGHGVRNVLIVGGGKIGHKLATILDQNQHLGLKVKGFIDDYKNGDSVLGQVKDLPQVLQRYFIEEVFITIPSERDLVKRVAIHARGSGVDVRVIPELFDGIMPWKTQSFEFFGDLPLMELYRKPIPELGLIFKRIMDIVGAFFGIAISTPIMLAIAIAIKMDSPDGPIIYRSRRIGKKGQIFDCYKFRTMVSDADQLKDKLRYLNEKSGPFFKITNDPRLTRVGKLLRKYNMDEMPQFFNVLEGDMSLVGPRPHPLDDFRQYNLEHYRRLDVKPGITSLWAIEAQDDPSFEHNMELDLYYIENWNSWLDLKILLRTIPTVLKGVGR